MKKLSILILLFTVLGIFIGCDVEDPEKKVEEPTTEDTTKNDPTVDTLAPASYTQKVLLEYFSGAWCGYCPDGKLAERDIRKTMPEDQFYAMVYHFSDQMDISEDDQINNKFTTSYPAGMINRVNGTAGSRSGWQSITNNVKGLQAKCGLAISSEKVGGMLNVSVKLGIGPASLPDGNYFISVFITEDEMTGNGTGWDQRNYYSQFGAKAGGSSHEFYTEDDPIIGYVHTNVVRDVLQKNALGQAITDKSALEAQALTEFNFTTDISSFDSDLRIVAFVHEFKDTPTSPGVESSFVYNIQSAEIGEVKNFD